MSDRERGSVVAEFAIALPAVVVVLAIAIGGVQLAGQTLRAQDAAADAARSYGRGESRGAIAAHLARQIEDATLALSTSGDLACARVTVRPKGPLARFGVAPSGASCALSGGR
ncbi:MAG TPA: TadE family type IV pilus minor pilin [Pseudolysinimonas sp.]|nr:TadE family type IV pilus minor pilin [Pseudolysinimonas sp.]